MCFFPPPGQTIPENIHAAINSSRIIIIVLSNSYLSHPWCRYELQASMHEHMKRQKKVLIIKLSEIDWTKIASSHLPVCRVLEHTYLAWPKEPDMPYFEKNALNDAHNGTDGNVTIKVGESQNSVAYNHKSNGNDDNYNGESENLVAHNCESNGYDEEYISITIDEPEVFAACNCQREVPLLNQVQNKDSDAQYLGIFRRLSFLAACTHCFSRPNEDVARRLEKEKELFWIKLLTALYKEDSVCGLSPAGCLWCSHKPLTE